MVFISLSQNRDHCRRWFLNTSCQHSSMQRHQFRGIERRGFPFPFLKATSHSVIFALNAIVKQRVVSHSENVTSSCLDGFLSNEFLQWTGNLGQFSERELLLLLRVLSAYGRGKEFCAETDSNMPLALLWSSWFAPAEHASPRMLILCAPQRV